jgi:hypothetical protein
MVRYFWRLCMDEAVDSSDRAADSSEYDKAADASDGTVDLSEEASDSSDDSCGQEEVIDVDRETTSAAIFTRCCTSLTVPLKGQ